MKNLWLDDEVKILTEMNRLVKERIRIICGRRGVKNLTKLPVKGIVRGDDGDLLILFHPHEPTCSSHTCTFYYHPKGEQLGCFKAVRVKKEDQYLALKMPRRIFNVYVRHHERVRGARGSSLTFVIPNKQRILAGKIENISLEGCKVTGNIPAFQKKGETVNNLTLALYLNSTARRECRLNIPEATIAWAKTCGERTEACGIHFRLTDHSTKEELSEYIDLRLIENNR